MQFKVKRFSMDVKKKFELLICYDNLPKFQISFLLGDIHKNAFGFKISREFSGNVMINSTKFWQKNTHPTPNSITLS